MWYYFWRVMIGFYYVIEYNFFFAGYIKFLLDWCFGLVKQKIRKIFILSLFDIVRVVEEFVIVNIVEFVGLYNGIVFILIYDWMIYFG